MTDNLNNWYYAESENQVGSVSLEDIKNLVADGKIGAETSFSMVHASNRQPSSTGASSHLTQAAIKENGTPSKEETPPLTQAEIEKNSVSLDYRKAMLEDYEKGTWVKLYGQVVQRLDTAILVDLLLGGRVWVEFGSKPKVLKDDLCSFYGKYLGTKTYNTVLGAEQEVPFIEASFFKGC